MKIIAGLVLCLALLCPGVAAAARLALVIGIDDYENIAPISKAVGDAEAMAETLSSLGFEVTKVLNPDRRALNQAITAFRRALKPGDAALVHFSGHGVEIGGRNLLLPRDAPNAPPGEEDYLIAEAIDLTGLIDRVADSGAAVRIFIIDACRDNPLETPGERGFNRLEGLAPLDPPEGSFVLFSAASRQAALDDLGPGDDSPTSVYTRVLIDKLQTPGLTLSDIAREVRVEVAALAVTIGRDQSPAYYDELNQDFILVPAEPAPIPAPARPPAPAADAEAFALAQSFNSIPAWQAFLKSYPSGFHADMARVALNQLLEQASRPSEITASPNNGLVATLDFPLPGEVISFTLDVAYNTECANDLEIMIVSPTGGSFFDMRPGHGRSSCRGIPEDHFNHNDYLEWVRGTEAKGIWRFVMRDLGDNDYTGRLDTVSLTITVDNEGVITTHKVSLDGLPMEIPSRKQASLSNEIKTSARDGLVASLDFPLPGEITSWVLDFSFTTECESDHQAYVTSPTGRRIKVLQGDPNRCDGISRTHRSRNDEGDWVIGSEAEGTWRFAIEDGDDNAYTASLDAVSLEITVDNDGIVSEHKVSLDGLPREIPNPTDAISSRTEGSTGSLTVVVREFSGRLPVGYRTERANTRDCPTPCAVDEFRTVTLKPDGTRMATLTVELPVDATRACLNMRGSASIKTAVLVMADGRRIASQLGGDLAANGKSACTFWTANAHQATSWEVTLQ